MEHILQFGIGIDDEAIIRRVEARAEDEIMQEIKRDAKAAIFKPIYPNNSAFTRNPTDFFDEKMLEEAYNKAEATQADFVSS